MRLCAAILVLALVSLCPGADAPWAEWGLRHWSEAQGLPQDTVLAMLQSRDGYLWLGTENGLARFDGVRFTNWNQRNSPGLGSNFVQALAEDRAGDLWIGTAGGGLSRMRGGTVKRFAAASQLGGHTIYSLHAASDGALWVGTEQGLAVVRTGGVHRFTAAEGFPEAPVYSVAQTRNGDLWFATYGSGLGRVRHGQLTRWTKGEGLADNRVILVHAGDGEAPWVTTYGGALQRCEGGRLVTWRQARAHTNRGIWAITSDAGGRTWLGSFGAGLGWVDGQELMFPAIARVSAESVWSLLKDREGNLWVGTSEGLYQFRELPLHTYSRADGLPGNVVSAVWEDHARRLWVGTNAGLVIWPRRKVITPFQVLSAMEDAAGGHWLGTADRGLFWLRPGEKRLELAPGPWGQSPIHALAFDGSGELLVGTVAAGLFRCAARLPLRCRPVPEARSQRVVALLRGRNGDLWVGTRDGLARRSSTGWQHLTTAEGLGSNLVTALHEDTAGRLWIGTEGGGLARYADGKLVRASSEQGLIDDIVYAIREDGEQRLWLGSPGGITRLEMREFPAVRQVARYGLLDGMLATQCFADTPNASAAASDGAFWFATMKGLVRFYPDRIRPNRLPPPVHIEEVRIDGVRAQRVGDTLTIPPGSRRIEVSYTALSLAVPERQQFRYRLDGYDPDWVVAGTTRIAPYTNLRPGSYTLWVQAANNDGVWNEAGKSLRVVWQPEIWQTWWFVLGCAAAVGGVCWWAYRFHLRQVEVRHSLVLDERSRIAREIHDTYLQGFTGIALQLEALGRMLPASESAVQSRLEVILSHADQSLREGRQSVWNLRRLDAPGAEGLAQQLRVALEPVLMTAGLACHCYATGEHRPLPPEAVTELVRLFEEAAHNVVRHAQASLVTLRVESKPLGCQISLTDDGVGFSAETGQVKAGHFGLVGMRERARRLGANLQVTSRPDHGTAVAVWLPWPPTRRWTRIWRGAFESLSG